MFYAVLSIIIDVLYALITHRHLCASVAIDRIDNQNELIRNAQRSVAETEEVGLEITAELARNREKIESSRAKVRFRHRIKRHSQRTYFGHSLFSLMLMISIKITIIVMMMLLVLLVLMMVMLFSLLNCRRWSLQESRTRRVA